MSKQVTQTEIETYIRGQLVTLIRLSADRGIDIERLMREAIDFCDPEPPFSN